MHIITIHTEGSTVVINDLVRIECLDEENATLFAASFESDVYHHTGTFITERVVMFTVVRRGQQESEGNPIDIKTFRTRSLADDWIAAQKGEYYSPFDYYVRESLQPKT